MGKRPKFAANLVFFRRTRPAAVSVRRLSAHSFVCTPESSWQKALTNPFICCILSVNTDLKDGFPYAIYGENLFVKAAYNIYVFHFCKCPYTNFCTILIFCTLFDKKSVPNTIAPPITLEKLMRWTAVERQGKIRRNMCIFQGFQARYFDSRAGRKIQ